MDLDGIKDTYVVEIGEMKEKQQRALQQLQTILTQKAQLERDILLLEGEITNARKMLQRFVGDDGG